MAEAVATNLAAVGIRALDRKKRERRLHQIQRLLSERVVAGPIRENGFIRGVGRAWRRRR